MKELEFHLYHHKFALDQLWKLYLYQTMMYELKNIDKTIDDMNRLISKIKEYERKLNTLI